MKHTSTPWKSKPDRYSGNRAIVAANGIYIAETWATQNPENDANRIISCVNALEGISNPEAIKELIEAAKIAERLLALMPEQSCQDQANNIRQALANLGKEV